MNNNDSDIYYIDGNACDSDEIMYLYLQQSDLTNTDIIENYLDWYTSKMSTTDEYNDFGRKKVGNDNSYICYENNHYDNILFCTYNNNSLLSKQYNLIIYKIVPNKISYERTYIEIDIHYMNNKMYSKKITINSNISAFINTYDSEFNNEIIDNINKSNIIYYIAYNDNKSINYMKIQYSNGESDKIKPDGTIIIKILDGKRNLIYYNTLFNIKGDNVIYKIQDNTNKILDHNLQYPPTHTVYSDKLKKFITF